MSEPKVVPGEIPLHILAGAFAFAGGRILSDVPLSNHANFLGEGWYLKFPSKNPSTIVLECDTFENHASYELVSIPSNITAVEGYSYRELIGSSLVWMCNTTVALFRIAEHVGEAQAIRRFLDSFVGVEAYVDVVNDTFGLWVVVNNVKEGTSRKLRITTFPTSWLYKPAEVKPSEKIVKMAEREVANFCFTKPSHSQNEHWIPINDDWDLHIVTSDSLEMSKLTAMLYPVGNRGNITDKGYFVITLPYSHALAEFLYYHRR